ncbi:MAG: hypothetical protein CVV53_10080, partial [Spirochaetae bacterium HGW-Spirochaetae-9]
MGYGDAVDAEMLHLPHVAEKMLRPGSRARVVVALHSEAGGDEPAVEIADRGAFAPLDVSGFFQYGKREGLDHVPYFGSHEFDTRCVRGEPIDAGRDLGREIAETSSCQLLRRTGEDALVSQNGLGRGTVQRHFEAIDRDGGPERGEAVDRSCRREADIWSAQFKRSQLDRVVYGPGTEGQRRLVPNGGAHARNQLAVGIRRGKAREKEKRIVSPVLQRGFENLPFVAPDSFVAHDNQGSVAENAFADLAQAIERVGADEIDVGPNGMDGCSVHHSSRKAMSSG